WQRKILS
ncbi:1-deoxy-D-xylulose-5-phosphate synthase, partial [Vibrio parahaemolyticus AQ3810]